MHEGQHQRADPVRVGELQVWDLINETGQDHPFHLHGFFFQVVEEDSKAPPFMAWKDTVNVPRKSQTRIAWLPDDRPGRVDVPLPHSRTPCDGNDGSLRSRPLSLFGRVNGLTGRRWIASTTRRDSRPAILIAALRPLGDKSRSHDGDPARGFWGNGIAPGVWKTKSVRGRLEGTRRDCLAAARAGERTRRANTIDAPTRLVPSIPNVSLYPLFASFLLFFCGVDTQIETGS